MKVGSKDKQQKILASGSIPIYNDIMVLQYETNENITLLTDFGGKVEYSDKSSFQCAIRELLEETNNHFNKSDFIRVIKNVYIPKAIRSNQPYSP